MKMASTNSSALRWALARAIFSSRCRPNISPLRTGSVKNAVAEEEEDIACLPAQVQFVVGGVGEQTDGQVR